jgi:predicted nucleic acid-binding protein
VILASLQSLTQAEHHPFLPDSVSLLGEGIDREHLLSSGQITDSYLLRLAASHGAKLATFDRRIVTSAIAGGDGALLAIP